MIGYTDSGMKYQSELVSSEGEGFILFPEQKHTKKHIAIAKSEIRHKWDAVYISIADDYDRDQLYRTEIFEEPEVRPLRWFQVNTDKDLIRQERIKGTSPKEYVRLCVLPYIQEIEAKNREKYGDSLEQF